tara:strand:- start:646 stop:921 length:276 start_codon:yes stop_codon:yes gene_type:complete
MSKEIRQSGRTTRIIDFTIEQLCSVGECIVTDHTVFEYPNKVTNEDLKYFIERVDHRLQHQTNGYNSCKGEIKKVDDIKVIHFKLNQKEDE